MSEPLEYWREGAVAHLRFNRPQALNAIHQPMARAFSAACEQLTADSAAGELRAVWLRGSGQTFMAGGDLQAMQTDPQAVAAELIEHMHRGLLLLAQLPVPVLASVQGAVAGGGLGVMLGCDLVLAAENARFVVAYPGIGASADCSTSWGLTQMLGLRKAMELALLNEPIDAQQALQLGLVNRVVPTDQLDSAAAALVQRLATGPTRALGRLKQLVRAAPRNDLATHLQMEGEGFLQTAASDDFREGVAAFLEIRSPRFQGR